MRTGDESSNGKASQNAQGAARRNETRDAQSIPRSMPSSQSLDLRQGELNFGGQQTRPDSEQERTAGYELRSGSDVDARQDSQGQ